MINIPTHFNHRRLDQADRVHAMNTPLAPHLTRSQRLIGVLGVGLLGAIVCWGLIFTGNLSGRGAADDLNYHWIAIQQFAHQLPNPDLSDYASATTPGYHLILAIPARLGSNHQLIQLIASVWTIGLLALIGWVVSKRFGRGAILIVLPMIASMYVFYPGVWLLPDNAGWVGVLAILLIALRPTQSWKTWLISSFILIALVWMRQIHIWIAGVIWLSAWIGSTDQTPSIKALFSDPIEQAGRTFIAIACTIPAFMTLAWFMGMWGGLVPPTFQDQHQGPNLATPGYILTQLSILSVFYGPMLWRRLIEIRSTHWRWILLAAIIGVVLGVVPQSSYSYDAGRYSGWWNLIKQAPTIVDRSPIFILGSIVGSITLVVWLSLSSLRDSWVWTGMMVAFILAQSANHASWQRYHEPMLLMMIILILARSELSLRSTRSILIGSVLLSAMLGTLSVMSIINAQPIQ